MANINEDDQKLNSNLKQNDAITIHLPNVTSFDSNSKYEPNYIAVEPQVVINKPEKVQQQQQQQHQQQQQQQQQQNLHHSEGNTVYNFSTTSSPEYTELILTKENLQIHDNSDESNYNKFPRQFSKQQDLNNQNYSQQVRNLGFNELNQQQQQQTNKNLLYYQFPNQTNDDNISISYKSQRRIAKGKAFPRKHFSADTPKTQNTNTTQFTIVSQDDGLKYLVKRKNDDDDGNETRNINLSTNDLNYKSRNNLIERRVAIRRAHSNSRGLLSITTPIDDNKRSENFIFAVANEHDSENNGYNSVLDAYNRELIYSPDYIQSANKNKIKTRAADLHSAKTKSESNHSTVTFLYKDKRKANNNDIISYEQNYFEPHGPSPASYHIPRRPPNEKVSPSYSFGTRCLVEKKGGGRTSWEKEWFSSKNPFIIKTDFKRDKKWPTPHDYSLKPAIGNKTQLTFHQYPIYSMGTKLNGSDNNLGENNKDKKLPYLSPKANSTQSNLNNELTEKIDQIILKPKHKDFNEKENQPYYREHKPRITIKSRQNGTQLWPKKEATPGPGAHDHTKFNTIKPSKPSFRITNTYNNVVNYTGGPYAVI